MADPRLILGRILVVNGTSPGRGSAISYTIAVHDPNVEGVYKLENQKPIKRWPDDIDTEAHNVGDIVVGSIEGNRVRWHFMETPAFAECPTVEQPSPIIIPEDPLVLPVVTPYPTTGRSEAGSAQVAPAPPLEPGE